jgi:hypothetical protein
VRRSSTVSLINPHSRDASAACASGSTAHPIPSGGSSFDRESSRERNVSSSAISSLPPSVLGMPSTSCAEVGTCHPLTAMVTDMLTLRSLDDRSSSSIASEAVARTASQPRWRMNGSGIPMNAIVPCRTRLPRVNVKDC